VRRQASRDRPVPLIQDEDSINFVDLLDNLLQYRWYMVITVVVCAAFALFHAMTVTPIYTADALIQIEIKESGTSSLSAFEDVSGGLGGGSPVPEEIEIIKSRTLIARVIEALNLNIVVDVENRVPLIGDWLSRILSTEENGLVRAPVGFVSYAWGGEALEITRLSLPGHLMGQPLLLTVRNNRDWTLSVADSDRVLVTGQGAGQLVTTADGAVQIEIAHLVARSSTVFKVQVISPFFMVGSVLGPLKVEPVASTNLIRLSFNHPEPSEAAKVLNTITQEFKEQNLERRSEESKKTLAFLQAEIPKLRTSLDQSELALNTFMANTKTVDISFELQQLLELSISIEARIFESQLKRRELGLRYDPSYPAMTAIDDQMSALLAQKEMVTARISKLPALQQDFIRLNRNVGVNNQLYISLLNSAQQLEIAKAGTIGNVAIIDNAITPRSPSRPNKSRIVLIGVVIGLLLGFILTQLMAFTTKVVRDPKKLELEIGVPTLSIMPLDAEQSSRAQSGDQSAFMLANESPDGAGVEALRSLRTALMFALSEKPRSKVVLITSAVPSQGKSFISANLSCLLGATGKRALLIEADIRKTSLQRYFDYDQKSPGLSSVLRGDKTVDEVILKSDYENLDFLPAGARVRNTGDLLAGETIQSVINDLAQQYDYVVIDSPPLLPVHDARSLGKAADVSLFVVRQDAVSLTEVQDAIDVFNKSGNFFDGVVFNGFVPSRVRYGYGYGYGYGSKYGRKGKYASYGKYGKYYDSSAELDLKAKK